MSFRAAFMVWVTIPLLLHGRESRRTGGTRAVCGVVEAGWPEFGELDVYPTLGAVGRESLRGGFCICGFAPVALVWVCGARGDQSGGGRRAARPGSGWWVCHRQRLRRAGPAAALSGWDQRERPAAKSGLCYGGFVEPVNRFL